MQFENPQELPMDDSLQDDMLYGIKRSDPYMQMLLILWLQVMYHKEATKGNSSRRAILTYGMNHTSSEYALMIYSEDVCQLKKESK